jgi:glycerol-3-phosphate acyltransferase PlsY
MPAVLTDFSLNDGLMVLVAYLVGGLSPGYILVRLLRGIDLRSVYSGSLGARNAGRVLGREGFYATLIIDILKGFVVVLAARALEFSPAIVGAVTVAVIAGHIWPIWLHFRGGKGIATSMGAFGALDITLLVIGGLVLLITYQLTRRFLPSWIGTLAAMPVIAFWLDYPMVLLVTLLTSAAIILIAHKDNIQQSRLSSEHKA